MSSNFHLIITADYPNRTAELRLLDAHGSQLAFRQTDFKTIAVSRQQGLFDLRNHLRDYVENGKEAASVAEIGVCIAEELLGKDIFLKLWESTSQRALRIQLPGATAEGNHLAAALARVPWEIARPSVGQPTLGERNLLVRVVHNMKEPCSEPLDLGPSDCLRVLFVFAEARGSRPLALRLERRKLRQLFESEIYPKRRVVAHFLSHGVTRGRLEDQIQENNGYHIVHWSGHGHQNLLELAKPGGAQDLLSGKELLDLFNRAGGFIPRLFFLSACHSGDIVRVKDWNDFLAVAQGRELSPIRTPAPEPKNILLDERPGYTGTAHSLIQGGVSTVVAMRYAVGDDYARELGVKFYRALLAHEQPKTAGAALTMARQSLSDSTKQDDARYDVCDHATPVLYGAEQPGLKLQKGRSPGLDSRNPRLHQIGELTAAGQQHFVGRTWELAGLGADFIGSKQGAKVKPVAVITGLGGMGKTALTAEALALWELRFEWVLLYQAKPNALGFDDTLRDIHMKLDIELGSYHKHVEERPADGIYRPANAEFTGQERLERLTRNLVRALRDESILLVLDNFENNLKPQPEPSSAGAEPAWACQDPTWDRCLSQLAAELVGTPSRVLITCRQPLAALTGMNCKQVLLGPLPAGEAALYLREHAGLSRMIFSGDTAERDLAMRTLKASRFHPLLMDRLARLAAGGTELRPQLMKALVALETSDDYTQLPALFATGPADAKELAYLNDALTTSLDHLIRDAIPDARRLLWMIAMANDPVPFGMLNGVWSGDSELLEPLRRIKQMLDNPHAVSPELQERLKAIPPEDRTTLDALPPESASRPDPVRLLRHLVAVGLANEERAEHDDANPYLTCHELVRERIRAWMHDHPLDRGELTENTIRLAYAERLEAVFKALQHKNMTAAIEAGSRALVYCAQAEAYDRLVAFGSDVVTSSSDPRLLAGLLPHLVAAAESAPEGRPSWSCLCLRADAMLKAGCPDQSLPLYERAVALARSTADAGGVIGRRAWADVAAINCNWANALRSIGDLTASRQRQLDSIESGKKAGAPAVDLIGKEMEILRIDIMQGQAAQALPLVEKNLAQVEDWWKQHRAGRNLSEAPNPEMLARVLISALDIARQAYAAQKDWEAALGRVEATLDVQRSLERPAEDIVETRMNRANVLGKLGRLGDAKAELESCLQSSKDIPAVHAFALSSLASIFNDCGDVAQAITQQRRALALRNQLPDPRDRAHSHDILAVLLQRTGVRDAVLIESPHHRLAALVYRLVSGLDQDLWDSLNGYAKRFCAALEHGVKLPEPGLSELVAEPEFHPLDKWLRERPVDMSEVEAAVDNFRVRALLVALGQVNSKAPASGGRLHHIRAAGRWVWDRLSRMNRHNHSNTHKTPTAAGRPARET